MTRFYLKAAEVEMTKWRLIAEIFIGKIIISICWLIVFEKNAGLQHMVKHVWLPLTAWMEIKCLWVVTFKQICTVGLRGYSRVIKERENLIFGICFDGKVIN